MYIGDGFAARDRASGERCVSERTFAMCISTSCASSKAGSALLLVFGICIAFASHIRADSCFRAVQAAIRRARAHAILASGAAPRRLAGARPPHVPRNDVRLASECQPAGYWQTWLHAAWLHSANDEHAAPIPTAPVPFATSSWCGGKWRCTSASQEALPGEHWELYAEGGGRRRGQVAVHQMSHVVSRRGPRWCQAT